MKTYRLRYFGGMGIEKFGDIGVGGMILLKSIFIKLNMTNSLGS